MNVALICNEYPPQPHGGIGTFVHSFAHGLDKSRHRVTVVGIGDADVEREDDGVRVVMLKRLRIRKVGWLLDRLKLRAFLQRQVGRGELDVVEVPDFEGMLPFGVRGVPCVVRLHCSTTTLARCAGSPLRLRTEWCERETLRKCGNWIAVSKHAMRLTKESFPGLSSDRSSCIYNPISHVMPSRCATVEAPAVFVLHAGYVAINKGAILLAEAAKQFLMEFPNLHIVYAGTVISERGIRVGEPGAGRGVDHLVLETLGPTLGERCHFLGFVNRFRLLDLMRRAKAFVFPSSVETFGLVVAEAMQQGCPVIVPNSGPFNEFVRHEQTGLLFDRMQPGAIAECVAKVLRNPELAQRLGNAAQRAVTDRFSLDRNIQETLAFYERCAGGERWKLWRCR